MSANVLPREKKEVPFSEILDRSRHKTSFTQHIALNTTFPFFLFFLSPLSYMSSSSEPSVGGEESTEGGGSVGGSGGESTGGSTEGSVDSSPELGKEGPLPELAVYIKAFESARSKGLKYQTDGM
jgi:hypothetical protein